MMVRLLHISDLHLDSSFRTKKPEVAKRLRDAQHRSFFESVTQALALKCDIFVMTGDIFHGHEMTFKTEDLLHTGLIKLLNAGVYVIYQTGNHDFRGLQRSLKSLMEHPLFVCFHKPTPHVHRITIRQVPVAIVGCGHDEKSIHKNWAKYFPKANPEELTIGIYHGMVLGSSGHDEEEEPYMACSLEDLTHKNYHYWALGHVHKRQRLTNHIAYAGSLQAIRRCEVEKKGAWLVELDQDVTELHFVPLSCLEFRGLRLKVSDENQHISLYQQLKNAILEAMGEDQAQFIFNVTLMGRSEEYDKIKSEDFTDEFLAGFSDERLIDLEINMDYLAATDVDQIIESHYLKIALNALKDPQGAKGFHERLMGLEAQGLASGKLLADARGLENMLIQYFKEV